MAVSVANATATAREASNLTSDSFAFDVGSGANRYLLVGISGWDNTSSISSITCTFNGVDVPLLGGNTTGGNNQTGFWGLVAPASGSNTLALANIPSGFAELAWGAIAFEGVDQTTPVGSVQNDTTDPWSIAVTLASGDMAADVLYAGEAPTIGADQTQRVSLNYQSSKWIKMSTETTSPTATMSWSPTNFDGMFSAIAIKQSTGGGGGASILRQMMAHHGG